MAASPKKTALPDPTVIAVPCNHPLTGTCFVSGPNSHAQRFLSVHGLVQNLFRVGRHRLRAVHYRLLRTRSLGIWAEVTGAC
jgi:hypothetical protein